MFNFFRNIHGFKKFMNLNMFRKVGNAHKILFKKRKREENKNRNK
jgi:hypothetical protein